MFHTESGCSRLGEKTIKTDSKVVALFKLGIVESVMGELSPIGELDVTPEPKSWALERNRSASLSSAKVHFSTAVKQPNIHPARPNSQAGNIVSTGIPT